MEMKCILKRIKAMKCLKKFWNYLAQIKKYCVHLKYYFLKNMLNLSLKKELIVICLKENVIF